MSADEMFENLGYEKQKIHPEIIYKNKNSCIEIEFNAYSQTIEIAVNVGHHYYSTKTTMEELQAIYEKCKELGWIN